MPAKKEKKQKRASTKKTQKRKDEFVIKREPDGKFKKGHSANPYGIPKGLKQKMTQAKELLFDALLEADGANGKEGLKEWLNSSLANKREFFKLAFGALPKDLNIEGGTDPQKIVLIRHSGVTKDKGTDGDKA